MQSLWNTVTQFFSGDLGTTVITSLVILVVGLIIARLLRSLIRRVLTRNMNAAHAGVVSRLSFSLMAVLVVLLTVRQLGADLSVLLGAAGILTVALGFASQTSASNLISGIFLLGERPFVVGDLIKVGMTTGEVVSVDLLSVKLRTFDNLFVRVPNETLLKTEITTLTRYPIRRLDLHMTFDFEQDLDEVKAILDAVVDREPHCLDEPDPVLHFEDFREGAQHIKYAVWVQREQYVDMKNELPKKMVRALRDKGTVFAVPRRAVHIPDGHQPLEIRMDSKAFTGS